MEDQAIADGVSGRSPKADRIRAGASIAACGVAVLCIASSWRVSSQTFDEPTHLAAGMEWWQRGTYTLQHENPPLAPVAIAAAPYLAGLRIDGRGFADQQGLSLLYGSGDPRRVLALARAGVVPFFVLAVWVAWQWTSELAGTRAALVAVLLCCSSSPFVGHAGLATTDVAFSACFILFGYTSVRWLAQPGFGRALAAGLALGAALATKLTALVFVPTAALCLIAARLWAGAPEPASKPTPRRVWLGSAALVATAAALLVWSSYRGSFGSPDRHPVVAGNAARCAKGSPDFVRALVSGVSRLAQPAPELGSGLLWACAHYRRGHPAYLLGEVRGRGFWSFYPVAIGVKTPLPLLLLGLGGIAWGLREARRARRWTLAAPLLLVPGLVAVAMGSRVDVGLRHLLVVQPLLAIAGGQAATALWGAATGRGARAVVAALIVWQVAGFAMAHPNHFSAFNALAPEPGRVLVDSDLDWGQDLWRLEAFFRDRGAEQLHIAYFGSARLCEHALPPLSWLSPVRPVTGWIAISESYFRGRTTRMYADPCAPASAYPSPRGRRSYRWLREHEPVARVGDSIRVYHIPER